MKNRNEDSFGIITDENHQFNSIEEAGNYVKDLKDKLKRKASFEEFPVSCAMPEERLEYIKYGISLMTRQNLPFADMRKVKRGRAVLWLVAIGYTFPAIAGYLKKQGFGDVTIEKIREVEKEGMRYVMDAIAHVKNNKTPIIGG